jgi:transcriptional regulator with XRE-family HTH domain
MALLQRANIKMSTKRYIKHPIVPTKLGQNVLRARFSLKETQVEFAKRFQIAVSTLHNWETGKTQHIQRIHLMILDSLLSRLRREGMLLPEAVLTTVLRENLEVAGNALK